MTAAYVTASSVVEHAKFYLCISAGEKDPTVPPRERTNRPYTSTQWTALTVERRGPPTEPDESHRQVGSCAREGERRGLRGEKKTEDGKVENRRWNWLCCVEEGPFSHRVKQASLQHDLSRKIGTPLCGIQSRASFRLSMHLAFIQDILFRRRKNRLGTPVRLCSLSGLLEEARLWG